MHLRLFYAIKIYLLTYLPAYFIGYLCNLYRCNRANILDKQESPAIADKPARRESLPKIAPIRRAYNVVADDAGLSSFFIRLAVVASEICEIPRNSLKIQTYGVQGYARSSILVSMESPYVTSY